MRKIIIALFVSVLLISVGIYISVNISPFKNDTVLKVAQTDNILTNEKFIASLTTYINNGYVWDFLNIQNFFSWLAVWSLSFISLFSFFHLLLDKLFFRKFYEDPGVFKALRRGLFLCICLVGTVFLRLINGFVWYNVLSIFILFLCIELVIINLTKKKSPENI
jgi:hypothetical protein